MSHLSPTAPAARLQAIDAVRGLALLGIFFVNIQSFGEPFGSFILPTPGPNASSLDAACFYFVKIFCESKFYPLFSMLFGMGMALQWQRARESGRPFFGTGIRRQVFLCLFGLTHILLLWYGDVLFLYSIAGMVLLPLLRARPKTLLIVCGCFLLISVLLMTGFGALTAFAPQPEQFSRSDFPHYDDPFMHLMDSFRSAGKDGGSTSPASPVWLGTEIQAYSEGPYDQVFKFRLLSWAMMLIVSIFGFGWHIFAMFCLGAALLKLGIFSPERRPLRRRILLIGFFAGLPLCIAAAFLPSIGPVGVIAAAPLTLLAGPLVSVTYLCAIAWLVDTGRAARFTGALANVGRLALTNYLMQSIIATTVFYYYGFGLFAQTTRTERIAFVFAVYLAQAGFSAAWLRMFAFGPAEWLWRSATYLRLQPIRRAKRPRGSASS